MYYFEWQKRKMCSLFCWRMRATWIVLRGSPIASWTVRAHLYSAAYICVEAGPLTWQSSHQQPTHAILSYPREPCWCTASGMVSLGPCGPLCQELQRSSKASSVYEQQWQEGSAVVSSVCVNSTSEATIKNTTADRLLPSSIYFIFTL